MELLKERVVGWIGGGGVEGGVWEKVVLVINLIPM